MKRSLVKMMWNCFPKKSISRMVGSFAKQPISKKLIPHYIRFFKIDLKPVKHDIDQFESLLDFFVRELHDDARPIHPDPDTIVSPVDGTISQFGEIENGTLLQAKGIHYSLLELLGNDEKNAAHFYNGSFMTIYLSPKDYHRIHMPISGSVSSCVYIPGNLDPVNQWGVQHVRGLFAQNERVISYINAGNYPLALIKVGALNVGSIKVIYEPELVTNAKKPVKNHKVYEEEPQLKKGSELGRFEFGSTVILLFPPNSVEWLVDRQIGKWLQMGQPIAKFL